jgi:probable addiction module antidote protein
MEKIQTQPWDAADHLRTADDMAAYLEAALEDGDPALITAVLGDIARARGIAQIARESGIESDNLFKILSPEGSPEFATVLRIIKASGIRLHATVRCA